MSYYESPEQLAANPPSTWRVEKRGDRWALYIDAGDNPVQTFTTKRAALAERDDVQGYLRRAIEQERRWYDGETPAGHNSYAECLAARLRNDAYQAERKAQREAECSNPNYRPEQWP